MQSKLENGQLNPWIKDICRILKYVKAKSQEADILLDEHLQRDLIQNVSHYKNDSASEEKKKNHKEGPSYLNWAWSVEKEICLKSKCK